MLKFFGRDQEDGVVGATIPQVTHPFANDGEVMKPSKPKGRWSKLFNVKAVGGMLTAAASELGKTGAAIVNPNAWAKGNDDYEANKARRRNALKMAGMSTATFAAKTAFVSGAAAVGLGAAGSIAVTAAAASAASATVKLATRFGKNAWKRYTSDDIENRPALMSKDDWKAVGKSALFGSVGGLIGGSIHELMGSPSFDDLKNMLGFGKVVDAQTVAQAAAVAPAAQVTASSATPTHIDVPAADTPEVVPTHAPAPTHVETPAPAATTEVPHLSAHDTQALKDQALELYRTGGTQEDVVRAIELYEQAAQGTGPGAIQAANDLQYLKNIGVYDTAMRVPVSPSSLEPSIAPAPAPAPSISGVDTSSATDTVTGSGDTSTGSGSGAPQVAAPVTAEAPARPTIAARCSALFQRITGFDKPRMSLGCDVPSTTPVLSGEAIEIGTHGVDGSTDYVQDAVNGGGDTTLGDFLPQVASPFRERVLGMAN